MNIKRLVLTISTLLANLFFVANVQAQESAYDINTGILTIPEVQLSGGITISYKVKMSLTPQDTFVVEEAEEIESTYSPNVATFSIDELYIPNVQVGPVGLISNVEATLSLVSFEPLTFKLVDYSSIENGSGNNSAGSGNSSAGQATPTTPTERTVATTPTTPTVATVATTSTTLTEPTVATIATNYVEDDVEGNEDPCPTDNVRRVRNGNDIIQGCPTDKYALCAEDAVGVSDEDCNPQTTGCANEADTIGRGEVKALLNGELHTIGEIELLYSPSCQTKWTRVINLNTYDYEGGITGTTNVMSAGINLNGSSLKPKTLSPLPFHENGEGSVIGKPVEWIDVHPPHVNWTNGKDTIWSPMTYAPNECDAYAFGSIDLSFITANGTAFQDNCPSHFCSGEECNGEDPVQMGCDKDAKLIDGETGSIELWWSEACETNWAVIHTTPNDGLKNIWVEILRDDGFKQTEYFSPHASNNQWSEKILYANFVPPDYRSDRGDTIWTPMVYAPEQCTYAKGLIDFGSIKEQSIAIQPLCEEPINSEIDLTSIDSDGDGLSDAEELDFGTKSYSWDSDEDGLTDAEEIDIGTKAYSWDSDGDGLSDFEEEVWHTDPFNSNTDGDELSDYYEVTHIDDGFHPLFFDEYLTPKEYYEECKKGALAGEANPSDTIPWLICNIGGASVPLAGTFADIRDAWFQGLRGEWVGAGFSLIGIIPAVGDAGKTIEKAITFIRNVPFYKAQQALQAIAKADFLPTDVKLKIIDAVSESVIKTCRTRSTKCFTEIGKIRLTKGRTPLVHLDSVINNNRAISIKVGNYTDADGFMKSWRAGETYLAKMVVGSTEQVTKTMPKIDKDLIIRGVNYKGTYRKLDHFDGLVGYEAKTGYVPFSKNIEVQIRKDAQYIKDGRVGDMEWHFFPSKKSNSVGADPKVFKMLEDLKIPYKVHVP